MTFLKKGTTSVTRYVKLIDSTTGAPKTAFAITSIDLQYTRNRATPAAKVDATALGATNSAFTANQAIEVDATSSPGLYRVDWPDAAFATGVDKVILCVSGPGLDPAFEDIELLDNMPGELAAGAITSASFAAGAIDASAIATDAIGAAELAADAVTEIQSGLATSATLALVKAKTDNLTYTIGTFVDVNIQAVNDVTIQGTGALGNEWRP